jgi:hypothetical protein
LSFAARELLKVLRADFRELNAKQAGLSSAQRKRRA